MRRSRPIFREKYKVKRPDGTVETRQSKWYYIRWTDARGRRRKLKAAPTYEQAREVLAHKQKEVADERAGIRRANLSEIRLDDLAAAYVESRRPHVGSKHVNYLRSTLGRVFDGTKSIYAADLDREQIEKYLNTLADNGRAGRTQNAILGAVKAMFTWAVGVGKIFFNPLQGVRARPQVEKKRKRRALSEKQVAELLAAAQDEKAQTWELPAYALSLYAALRQCDVARLRWADIDLETRAPSITIRAEADKAKRGAVLPIHPVLADILAAWKQATLALPAAPIIRFPNRPCNVLKATLARAGIPYLDPIGRVCDFHSLRHTCLTLLSRHGCDPRTLQALARHSTARLTLDVYVHRDWDREVAAVATLPDFTTGPAIDVREGTTGAEVERERARDERELRRDYGKAKWRKAVVENGKPVCNQQVAGSSPAGGSLYKHGATRSLQAT